MFWQLLTSLGEFSEGGEGEEVRRDRLVAGLVGEMNEDRKLIVRKVSLSHSSPPHLFVNTLFSMFEWQTRYHTFISVCLHSMPSYFLCMFFIFQCGHISPCSGVSIPSCFHTVMSSYRHVSIHRYSRNSTQLKMGWWLRPAYNASTDKTAAKWRGCGLTTPTKHLYILPSRASTMP